MATDWLERLFQVKSIFGRTGDVVATSGDYNAAQITYDPSESGLSATTVQAALDEIVDEGGGGGGGPADTLDFNGTELTCDAAPTDGQLLYRSGTSITGISASGLSGVANAVALNFDGTVLTCDTVPTDTHLLRRSGTAIVGVNPALLTVAYTTGLLFGASNRVLNSTVPTSNQLLVMNSGNEVAGISPGGVMARMTPANSSTAAITFTANARFTWNGSATPSFTIDETGAVDGATVTIYFTAGYLDATAFSTEIDATGTLAYGFDDDTAAYVLTLQYLAPGFILPSFRKIVAL